MIFFDPDEFAVTADPAGARYPMEGKRWAEWGVVRDVHVVPDEEPVRMVCFTANDMRALFREQPVMPTIDAVKAITAGEWPEPIFRAEFPGRPDGKVYLYPEADAIISVYDGFTKSAPGVKWKPDAVQRRIVAKRREAMLNRVAQIRIAAQEQVK